jgi:hypothetical protein
MGEAVMMSGYGKGRKCDEGKPDQEYSGAKWTELGNAVLGFIRSENYEPRAIDHEQ